jgi:glucokinase
MKEPVAIGVDIGGTSTKMGVVSHSGQILQRAEQLTPHDEPAQVIIDNITTKLAELVSWTNTQGVQPNGIGVSICGYLSPSGKVPDYINLHVLDHYPVVEHFSKRFNLPVVMDNDMNCGVLGEYHFGGGRNINRLMVMTIGTGVGMAMMINGKVVRLSGGTVGNPGHVIVDPDGPVCVAGCRGCLESLASAPSIARRAEDLARAQRATLLTQMLAERGSLTTEDLFHAAEAGDLPAAEIWEWAGKWLGRGLASWVEIFGPELVIVGGGVAKAGHWIIDPLEREMRHSGEPYFTRQVKTVKQSQLGKDIAMLGAASFYLFPENAPQW